MIAALRYFVTKQPLAFGICVAGLALAVFFGVKFLMHAVWMHDPAHRNQALEGWMRPRYVSMSYQVPPKVMREEILKIGPPPKEREREPITMTEIAAQKGITLDELTDLVRSGAETFHEGRRK